MSGLWVLILLITISSIPAAAAYIWFRLARYPFTLVRFLFTLLIGAAAVFPALFLQEIFPASFAAAGRWGIFIEIFLRIALTEELSRLLMLFLMFWISSRLEPRFRDSSVSSGAVLHGAAAGMVAGFGFAIIEGAIFGAADTGVLLLRVFTAAPLHGACGSRVGSAAVMFRSNPYLALFRFLAATAIHGVYNFMIIMPGFPSIVAVLIALSALLSSIVSIRNGWKNKGIENTGVITL